ncbi:MAG: PAS domain-containing protein, partial [Candidatus Kapaibacteriota bacterium]
MSVKIGGKYFKLNCTPSYNGNNQLKSIIHIAKDETENVLKEKRLTRLNKLLTAIKNFSQTVSSETLPEKILEFACEQLSQIRNYALVGFVAQSFPPLSEEIFYKTNLPIELRAEKIEEAKIQLHLKFRTDVKTITLEDSNGDETGFIKFEETINNTKLCCVAIPFKEKNELLDYFILIAKTEEIYNEEEISLLQEFIDNIILTFSLRQKIAEKEQIEKKSRELERFYYTLLKNLPGFVYRCRNDRYWTMEYLSENFYKITGYKPEEIIGNKVLSFNDLIHKDHQERLWVKWQIVLNKKEVFQDEYPIITKNGKIRWVFEQGRGIYDEKGKVIALEGYITDITERKEIEEKLKESEKRYRALFENSADAIFIMSGDIFIDCNLSALKMFKCERTEIIGKPPYEFSPEFQPDGIPSKKKAIDYITRAYRGEELRFEWMHKKLDGTEFECEVSLNKIIYGKKSFLVAIVRNISESKKALKEITKLVKALDSIGEAVSITDLSNRFIFINKAFEKLYGYTLQEIIGQTTSILRTEESLDPNIDKEIFTTLLKNQTWRGVLWNKDKYGKKFQIQLSTNSIFDEKGNVIGYIGVAIDLTERTEMEKALKENEEKFRTLISSLDDIAYTLDTKHRHNGLYGKWLENFGLKREDFIGKTALEILGEEDGKIHIE